MSVVCVCFTSSSVQYRGAVPLEATKKNKGQQITKWYPATI